MCEGVAVIPAILELGRVTCEHRLSARVRVAGTVSPLPAGVDSEGLPTSYLCIFNLTVPRGAR